MKDIKWKKPSGIEIVTNTEKDTIKAAVDLGWEQVVESVEDSPKSTTLSAISTQKTLVKPVVKK